MNYYSINRNIDFKELLKENKVNFIVLKEYERNMYKSGNINFEEWKDNQYITMIFSNKLIDEYESFICSNLKPGSWSEYIEKDTSLMKPLQGDIHLIIKLLDKTIKKYILDDNNELEILNIINEFSNEKYESIRKILVFDDFYRFYDVIELRKEDITKDFILECCEKGTYFKFLEPFKDDFNNYQNNVYLITEFDMEVGSGGLLNYLFQSGEEKVNLLLNALKELKIDKIDNIISESLKLLPSYFFELENIFCDELVEELENKFNDFDTKIYELVEEEQDMINVYINNNIDKFNYIY
ncbi:MAG: DUF4375 domain-containing protein [Bacilli bacterium]|nr:DUF4375 domain-containing protein [Bacilli bacterium]